MEARILKLLDRLGQVEDLLAQSEILADKARYKELAQEHAYLREIRTLWDSLTSLKSHHHQANLMNLEVAGGEGFGAGGEFVNWVKAMLLNALHRFRAPGVSAYSLIDTSGIIPAERHIPGGQGYNGQGQQGKRR